MAVKIKIGHRIAHSVAAFAIVLIDCSAVIKEQRGYSEDLLRARHGSTEGL